MTAILLPSRAVSVSSMAVMTAASAVMRALGNLNRFQRVVIHHARAGAVCAQPPGKLCAEVGGQTAAEKARLRDGIQHVCDVGQRNVRRRLQRAMHGFAVAADRQGSRSVSISGAPVSPCGARAGGKTAAEPHAFRQTCRPAQSGGIHGAPAPVSARMTATCRASPPGTITAVRSDGSAPAAGASEGTVYIPWQKPHSYFVIRFALDFAVRRAVSFARAPSAGRYTDRICEIDESVTFLGACPRGCRLDGR